MEDAEDYRAFEAAITADYDAQSAVERELILRLASLLWRLHRATRIEIGLFELQASRVTAVKRHSQQLQPPSREVVYALFRRANAVDVHREAAADGSAGSRLASAAGPDPHQNVELARCFLGLANLPNFALDRLIRYEATLWRQFARRFSPSMLWIAASHRKEGIASKRAVANRLSRFSMTNFDRRP
jgi:hypothetical protein